MSYPLPPPPPTHTHTHTPYVPTDLQSLSSWRHAGGHVVPNYLRSVTSAKDQDKEH